MTTNPAAAAVENAEPQILLGTAPDSWGVWFDRDPHQVEWKQYLDEAGAAGYVWTELGPYEFLPADPAQLSDELDARGLKPSGGAVFAGLHNGPEALQKELEDCGRSASRSRRWARSTSSYSRRSAHVHGRVDQARAPRARAVGLPHQRDGHARAHQPETDAERHFRRVDQQEEKHAAVPRNVRLSSRAASREKAHHRPPAFATIVVNPAGRRTPARG